MDAFQFPSESGRPLDCPNILVQALMIVHGEYHRIKQLQDDERRQETIERQQREREIQAQNRRMDAIQRTF